MKRLILLFISSYMLIFNTQAQYSMDFGISFGGSNYNGEIGGNGTEPKPWLLDVNLAKTNIGVGGFYRYNFTRNIAAKLSVNYARISATDSTSNIKTQIARNLSFRTDIIEVALTGEYYFFTINNLSRASNARIDFGAYAFAGAGIALYYPYAQYQNKWYYLRPLQTEGVENAYDEMTVILPFGAGANFTFNKKLKVGIEFGYRFTFTDYLDDISTDYAYNPGQPNLSSELPFEESKIFANRSDQAYARGENDLPPRGAFSYKSIRGNPDVNDGYILSLISVSYNIANKNSFHKARYNSVINRRRKRTKF